MIKGEEESLEKQQYREKTKVCDEEEEERDIYRLTGVFLWPQCMEDGPVESWTAAV